MAYTSIGSVLRANLQVNPDREALIFREQRFTYRQMGEQVDRVAAVLLDVGIRKGDKIAVDLPNWLEFVFVYFAVMRIGATIVLVNPRYRETEMRHILRDSDAVAIILPVEFENFRYIPMIQALRADLPDLRHVIAVGERENSDSDVLYFHELLARAGTAPVPDADIDPAQDLAFLMYTSGTTGKPKGAMITHANFVKTTEIASEPFLVDSADVFLVLVPITHIIGLFCMNTAFFKHAKVILVDVFKAEPVAQLIERERVTAQYAVPTVFTLELAQADRYDISSLRKGLIAGASVPAELLRRLVSMGIQVHPQYGMTETSGGLTTTFADDDPVDRTETVGRPLPGVQTKIVDDRRHPVPEGDVGELAVKSYGLMKGYYKQPEETAAAMDAEGWFYTGDLACRDGRGFIRIVGRKKDMIIRGGYNIYPREVEDLLYTCPNVQEAAVIGVPDPVLGEKTCACIQIRPNAVLTDAKIKEFCRGKIADYKVPDYVRFVESFPQTPTGKIYKATLKEQIRRALKQTLT